MGFIEEYRDFILEYVPTSPDWAESIACAVLSTALGPKRKIVSSKLGTLQLNLWFLMIGPSGLAHKTVPLKNFALPTLAQLTKKINYPVILPNRYSIEGLIEYLTNYSWGCIVRDEFTGLFKEVYSKTYLADAIEFMSELYDGTIQKRYTRKMKLEEAVDVYVVLLSATTPHLFRVMKPSFFIQGTGNRILYIIYKPENVDALSKEILKFTVREMMERENKIAEYAEGLAALSKCPIKMLTVMDDAAEMWESYRRKCYTEANYRYSKDIYDLIYTYIVRLPEMALKLSGLHAFSEKWKLWPKVRKDIVETVISKRDMEWAIKKVERHMEHFKEMLNLWRTRPEPVEVRTVEEQASYVLDLLADYPYGLTWGELRRKTRWREQVWSEVLKYLMDTESIVVAETTGKGKKTVLFFHKSHEANALVKGLEIIDNWEFLAVKLRFKGYF